MRYLIVQDWKNTSNNHAGMKYLALQLHKLYPDTIAVYIVPDYDGSIGLKRNIWGNFVYKLQNRVNSFFVKIGLTESRTEKRLQNIKKELTEVIKDGDEVFLMEYLEPLSHTENNKSLYMPLMKFGMYPTLSQTKIFRFFYTTDGKKTYFLPQKNVFCYSPKEFFLALSNSMWKTGFMKEAFKIPFPYYWIYKFIRR